MNNDNPLIPQGSLMEQKSKNKPHLRIAFVIAAVHVVLLGGFLIAGCKRDETGPPPAQTNEAALPPLDTLYGSNAAANLSSNDSFAAPILGSNAMPAPVLTPVAPPPTAPTAQEYVVARADSFYSIGKKFGVSANAIAKANPGVDSTRLKIGQKLQIPASASTSTSSPLGVETPFAAPAAETHTVKSGDTLTKIAREHGTTVAALKELNGLKIDRINLGQKLKLPAKPAPVEAPAPVVPLTHPSTNIGVPPPLTSTPISQ